MRRSGTGSVRAKNCIFGFSSSSQEKFSEFLEKEIPFHLKMSVAYYRIHARISDASWTRGPDHICSRDPGTTLRGAPLSMTRARTIKHWSMVSQTSVAFYIASWGQRYYVSVPNINTTSLGLTNKARRNPGVALSKLREFLRPVYLQTLQRFPPVLPHWW